MTHRGSCLCGLVHFAAKGDPTIVAHCFCVDCQKQSGAGHTTGAMFSKSDIEVSGAIKTYNLKSNNANKVSRVFCPECGSLIYSHNDKLTQYITIPLGIFEDSDSFVPEVSIFARNRKSWDITDEKIHTFEAQPEWKPKG